MEIENHYHEALEFGEKAIIFIIRALQERPENKKLVRMVEQDFPSAGNFKLPPGDQAIRITFKQAIELLREKDPTIGDYDDLS